MRALLRVEVRRLLARRLVRVVAAAVVAGSVATGIAVLATSREATPAQVRIAEAERQRAIEQCVSDGFNPPATQADAADRREFCVNEAIPAGQITFQLTDVLDILQGTDGKGSAAPLVIVSLLLGASFVGAEWRSRGLHAQLGWEPRRPRVAATKVGVAAAAVFGGALLAQAIVAVALVPAAILRGTTQGVDAGWMLSVGGAALRVALLSAIAAATGASLAMIGRSTAAALGAVLVYGLVEVVVRGFEDPAWLRWLAGENGGLFVVADPAASLRIGRSTIGALIVLAAYAFAIFGAAIASFRARDVS